MPSGHALGSICPNATQVIVASSITPSSTQDAALSSATAATIAAITTTGASRPALTNRQFSAQ